MKHFDKAFDTACFLMSVPFALVALVAFGIAWLCQQMLFILDPSWAGTQEVS